MHLTSADARAAREGFHFVVMRGGTRVAYTTTAAEAKRECGKGCKVYPLARMRYAAQNPATKRTQLASLDRRIAAAERAGMPVAYLLEQRDLLARRKKANPGLTKAGKRHLIQTMHKAGADTFTKKMRYVRKHMPHITDPAAFVGYVMQGEKR